MSDAKAKAEARRAKILARDKSKTVSAVATEEEDEGLLLALGETKAKERPLAARRSLIVAAGAKLDDETSTPVKQSEDNDNSNAAIEGDNPTSTGAATNSTENTKDDTGDLTPKKESAGEKNSDTPSVSEKKNIKLPPKKTLEEIEREIAENTKKFDEKTLGRKIDDEKEISSQKKKKELKKGDDDKNDNAEDKKAKETEKEGDKDATSEKVTKILKAKSATKYTVEPSTAMRILRVILIVLCAAWTGYRVVLRNKAALQIFSQHDQDEFDLSNNAFQQTVTTSTADRTWLQYFQYRINGQLEAPASAMMSIYWISKMFTPAVNAVFKVPKAKPSSPVQMIFEFLQTGLSTWMEGVYTVLGEMSLYFFVLIISVIAWTIYLADAVNQQDINQTSLAPLTNNNEL